MNLRTNRMHSIFIEIMQQIENVPVYINRQTLCETWALNSGKKYLPYIVLIFRIFATFSWYVCQYLLDVFVSVLVIDQYETLILSLSPMSKKFNENKKNNININRPTI